MHKLCTFASVKSTVIVLIYRFYCKPLSCLELNQLTCRRNNSCAMTLFVICAISHFFTPDLIPFYLNYVHLMLSHFTVSNLMSSISFHLTLCEALVDRTHDSTRHDCTQNHPCVIGTIRQKQGNHITMLQYKVVHIRKHRLLCHHTAM